MNQINFTMINNNGSSSTPQQHHGQVRRCASKDKWEPSNALGQDSLLGMAASFFDQRNGVRNSMASMSLSFGQQSPAQPEDIASQVLVEIAGDILDDSTAPITDDIFDIVPVPLRQPPQRQATTTSRLQLLEDTLDQVLNSEDFLTPTPLFDNATTASSGTQVNASPKNKLTVESSMMPTPKRSRVHDVRRFRPYQAEQWSLMFQELLDFRKERGHCCVPHTFPENPALSRWVKRQRYQYKLKKEENPSTITDERIIALEQVGFVWDSHGAAWEERWNELAQFQRIHNHANVPSNHHRPQLATWVKCQRRQYKLFGMGKPSNMNLSRIRKLEALGFEWELRGGGKSAGSNNKNQWKGSHP